MEEKFDELLLAKDWSELSQEEKDLALKFVASGDEFTATRKISLALLAAPKASIRPDKSLLRNILASSPANNEKSFVDRVISYKMPAYAVVLLAMGVAFVSLALAKSNDRFNNATAAQEKIVVRTDTVFVQRPPDTVFINKVVVKYIPQRTSTPVLTKTSPEESTIQGVTMKEKEELQDLLVTGVE
jgi:hypothetical protein